MHIEIALLWSVRNYKSLSQQISIVREPGSLKAFHYVVSQRARGRPESFRGVDHDCWFMWEENGSMCALSGGEGGEGSAFMIYTM